MLEFVRERGEGGRGDAHSLAVIHGAHVGRKRRFESAWADGRTQAGRIAPVLCLPPVDRLHVLGDNGSGSTRIDHGHAEVRIDKMGMAARAVAPS